MEEQDREEKLKFFDNSKPYKKDSLEKDHTRIYIGNLDYETKVSEVKNVFEKYGEIFSIQIRLGFAFIEYRNSDQAALAREKMNLQFFNGRRIIVRPALPKFDNESPPRSISPTRRKEDVDVNDKNTCFFCGKTGHWKKDCEKRQKYIEDKIASGELDRDYYGFKRNRYRLNKEKNPIRFKSRSRSRKKYSRDKERTSYSDSLSFSIPSDCESCKRILKEKKKKKKDNSHQKKCRYSLSPVANKLNENQGIDQTK